MMHLAFVLSAILVIKRPSKGVYWGLLLVTLQVGAFVGLAENYVQRCSDEYFLGELEAMHRKMR